MVLKISSHESFQNYPKKLAPITIKSFDMPFQG